MTFTPIEQSQEALPSTVTVVSLPASVAKSVVNWEYERCFWHCRYHIRNASVIRPFWVTCW